jgi:hypothetical protein
VAGGVQRGEHDVAELDRPAVVEWGEPVRDIGACK